MSLRSCALIVPVLAVLTAAPAGVQAASRVGILACDLSAGVGLVLMQKQTMTCTFRPAGGGPAERYKGTVAEYGIELGVVEQGHLVWAVVAAAPGVPAGALSGTYAGVAADAALGAGAGASALIGGTGRAFSLQPIAVEGEMGVNIAAGIRTINLSPLG